MWRRIVLFLLIFSAPLALVLAVTMPFISPETRNRYLGPDYRLPADLSKEAVARIGETLKKNPEFDIHFMFLPREIRALAYQDIYVLLKEARSEEYHHRVIGRQQQKVRELMTLLTSFDWPSDFIERPSGYPLIHKALWRFLFEEFKLNYLGATFKATYDPAFHLGWTKEEREKALTIQRILFAYHARHRKQLESLAREALLSDAAPEPASYLFKRLPGPLERPFESGESLTWEPDGGVADVGHQ